jgi:hypothetical protein
MAGAPMGKGGTGGGSGYGYMPMQQPASPGMGKGGIGGLPDIRASLDAYKGYEPSAATKAFWAAHPGYASTTYAPGYQQNWENNFNAQQQPGELLPPEWGISLRQGMRSAQISQITLKGFR